MNSRSLWALISVILPLCGIFANAENGLININPDPNGEPWFVGGINFEEWGANLPPERFGSLAKIALANIELPSKVDNSTHQAFRPVFNQKGGSCAQASGIAYQYTYEINLLRNLPSNIASNQYPYDFTYNFLNAGTGTRGSISTDGWAIVKALGLPDVQTYSGFGLGQYTCWMSGYDAYYKGMSNRLDSAFSFRIKTASDIHKMKRFLFDHSDGSAVGGLLNFAAYAAEEKLVSLANGTPEAGKKVVVAFGATGGHAMTIAGYNDSVRYDYNKDGRYTNDVDLNNDDIIDVRDWEIGAVYIVNSWGTAWGNGGKGYLMYKVLADDISSGGIWYNMVSGIVIKNNNVKPLLTYKVIMSFNPRASLRIKAGYAANPDAIIPVYTKTFGRAFNFSGGNFPMQGANNNTSIEIGLDVSDFVPVMNTSESAFFLQLEASGGTGKIEQFSLIDYTSGLPVETVCQNKDLTVSPGTTRLKIIKGKAPLTVVSPNGGEKWEQQRSFDILWNKKDLNPVVIELLKDGFFYTVICDRAPETGTFTWVIPDSVAPGTDYSIRIRNCATANITDVSDKPFSIEKKSELELVIPNAYSYILKGSSCGIFWKTTDSGLFRIDLYRHGVMEMVVDSGINAAANSYVWSIPGDFSSGTDYKIRITSKEKDWLYDESETGFGIGFPPVNTPYRQSFDTFTNGELLSGSWEQAKDDDIDWMVLRGATPSKVNPQAGGTGPAGDHTTGNGMYIYVEASTPNNPGKNATLLSPLFDLRDVPGAKASFWCHMFSRENRMGSLWVDLCADGQWIDSVLFLTGDHGDQWFQQNIDISRFACREVQFRFRVHTGTDYDSDICLDDFSITGLATTVMGSVTLMEQPSIMFSRNLISLKGYNGTAKIFTIDGKLAGYKQLNTVSGYFDISRLSCGTYLLQINNKSMTFVHR